MRWRGPANDAGADSGHGGVFEECSLTTEQLAMRIIPPGYRGGVNETRARIAKMVAEWSGKPASSRMIADVEQRLAEAKAIEERFAALRKSEQDYLASVEGIVKAALEYEAWMDGNGTIDDQPALWERLRGAVKAYRAKCGDQP